MIGLNPKRIAKEQMIFVIIFIVFIFRVGISQNPVNEQL